MIFTISEEGQLLINFKEARTIPCYRELIARDKTNRNKPVAFSEFLYIYLMYDPHSMYADLSNKERHEKAFKHAHLPDKWKSDDLVQKCIDHYIDSLELSHNYKAYIAAKRAVHSIGRDLDLFNEQKSRLKRGLTQVHKEIDGCKDEDQLIELLKKEERITDRMMKLTDNIQKITDRLPDNLGTVEQLKKILAQEQKKTAEVRGGGKIGRREQRK